MRAFTASDGIACAKRLARPLVPLPSGWAPRLTPLPGVRAVLFDVYGTLLISASGDIGLSDARAHAEASRAALRLAGFRPRRTDAGDRCACQFRAAIAARHATARAAGRAWPEVDVVEVWGAVVRTLAAEGCLAWPAGPLRARLRLLAVAFEGRVNPVWPMPGAAAVLRSLAGRGLPLGLVSNAQCYTPWFMQAAFGKPLRRLGLRRELLVWSYALGEAKPAAALFGQALTRLRAGWSIAPREVLYVGNDALKDVAPAQRAGCRTAFFAGDARSCRPSPGVKADIVLTALDQLPELVGRI